MFNEKNLKDIGGLLSSLPSLQSKTLEPLESKPMRYLLEYSFDETIELSDLVNKTDYDFILLDIDWDKLRSNDVVYVSWELPVSAYFNVVIQRKIKIIVVTATGEQRQILL